MYLTVAVKENFLHDVEDSTWIRRNAPCLKMTDLSDHAYFYVLKNEARRRVVDALNKKIVNKGNRVAWENLILCSINQEALDYARLEWSKHYGNDTHHGFLYSWERIYHRFFHRPSFFDVAIWQDISGRRVLQGMALGKPSNTKASLSINWVERSFEPTYFRGGILLPVLACAEEYAKLLGSSRVVIKDAVDPALYGRYGYTPLRMKKVGEVLVKEMSYG